jgi:hypothetical protein
VKNNEPAKKVAAVTAASTLSKYRGSEPNAKQVDPMAKSHAIATVNR